MKPLRLARDVTESNRERRADDMAAIRPASDAAPRFFASFWTIRAMAALSW